MQEELTALEPELKRKSKETEELMQRLSVDREQANQVSHSLVESKLHVSHIYHELHYCKCSFLSLHAGLIVLQLVHLPGAYSSGARRRSG